MDINKKNIQALFRITIYSLVVVSFKENKNSGKMRRRGAEVQEAKRCI
jgi:hypothetical protein